MNVILDDREIDPDELKDFDGVALLEVVDGQYLISNLQGDADANE